MKGRTVAIGICVAAALLAACSPATRHKVLTTMFDGVPPMKAPVSPGAEQPAAPGSAVLSQPVTSREHGPYAARQCDACHESGASNALVAPREQLCFRCHVFNLDKKYIHGPLASGGCLVCHDPHSSKDRYLLVSASGSFCLYCHERDAVGGIGAHHGLEENCTICHDAHMSDKKYLLK
jgi:predicted CXXCH cytochrome family protein